MTAPAMLDTVEDCARRIVECVGKDIRLGLPLGLGKPVELVNALYAMARADATLQLTILTALSLEKPEASTPVEKAFLDPFLERVFGDCPQLDYLRDMRRNCLPPNVRVCEFFFKPGSQLGNAHAQRNYISTNYTFAARDVFAQGCNVAAQIVARRDGPQGPRYSLSCNPDTSPELIALLRAAQAAGERRIAVVGVVNQNLPYMEHDAEVDAGVFDFVVDHPRYTTTLFSTPKTPVADADYAIGLHASALVRDGGTLQIGIGALGDAIVYALQLRHARNALYRSALAQLGVRERHAALVGATGGDAAFEKGLYGATEMFVDGLLHLHRDGILKRKVYDFWALQQLIDEGACDPDRLDPRVLDAFDTLGVRALRTQDFEILQHHGFFNDATRYERGHLITPGGTRVLANVADPQARAIIGAQCLGTRLRNGIVLHGGFFLGPRDFYAALHALGDERRREICMSGVDKINQLDRNPRLYQAQRMHARFVNTGIMVTLSGAVVSDALEDGRVISGVGGQYNFVAMAHQLKTGRSILLIRAVREAEGRRTASSNVVFNYAHCTIPRHLRDIIVTEYGIADLRAKTDNEVAKALLNIADSRFQSTLLAQAQRAGKIESGYAIPDEYCNNTPQALAQRFTALRGDGPKDLFPEYPLGTDFTPVEQVLARALGRVKSRAAATPKWKLALKALRSPEVPAGAQPCLERLQLQQPSDLQGRVVRALLLEELARIALTVTDPASCGCGSCP